jgi:hypothetical protein
MGGVDASRRVCVNVEQSNLHGFSKQHLTDHGNRFTKQVLIDDRNAAAPAPVAGRNPPRIGGHKERKAGQPAKGGRGEQELEVPIHDVPHQLDVVKARPRVTSSLERVLASRVPIVGIPRDTIQTP